MMPAVDATISMRSALARHYSTHGLPVDGGASDPWFRVRIGPTAIRLPNPPARRRAVFFHDVNHVLTGYDTTLTRGELSISAFEIGCGCGRYAIGWFINLYLMALGAFIRPGELLRAFVRGQRSGSIYRLEATREVINATSVAELRTRLAIDDSTVAPTWRERAAFVAWTLAAIAMMLSVTALPFALLLGTVALFVR